MQAALKLDHQLLAVEGEHDVHAMLELSLPEADDAATQLPLRLALVLDRSGSMAGDKLAVAQRCAAWLVSRLRPADELALVSYDDEVRLLAPLAPVQEGQLRTAIGGLRPGGSTNLSGGWLRGLEQLRGGRGKILLLVLRYVSVGEQIEQHELTFPLVVNLVSANEAAAAGPDLEVREEVLVLKAARARDEAIRLADLGENDQAVHLLETTANQLRNGGLGEEAGELELQLPLVSADSYLANPANRKQLRYQSHSRRRGR